MPATSTATTDDNIGGVIPTDPNPGGKPGKVSNKPPAIDSFAPKGLAKFKALLYEMQIKGVTGEKASDEFILNAQFDPVDKEFNTALAKAKSEARNRNSKANPKTAAGDQESAIHFMDSKAKPSDAMLNSQVQKRQSQDQMQYRDDMSDTAMLKGMPVDLQAAFEDANLDGFVQQFASNEELQFQSDDSRSLATKSGQYVYTGKAADSKGGAAYQRDQYLYSADAEAMLAGMDPATIKQYQAKLGLLESGVVDPDLQKLWQQAVETGQLYARAGKKVTLQFIFDSLVDAQVAANAKTGAGPRVLDEDSYYFAMMQILGDISGVGSGR